MKRLQRPTKWQPGLGKMARLAVVAAFAGSSVAIAGCATAAPYNPDHLASDQAARLGQICESVMGLSAREPLMWGDAIIGDPHLEPGANHFMGCVTVLSDSLRAVSEVSQARAADADCRAKGLTDGSPALAQCVLSEQDARAPSSAPVHLTAVDDAAPTKVGSMFFASPSETVRREKLACAAIGLEPPYGAFANCVKDMTDTFYAIDNPVE